MNKHYTYIIELKSGIFFNIPFSSDSKPATDFKIKNVSPNILFFFFFGFLFSSSFFPHPLQCSFKCKNRQCTLVAMFANRFQYFAHGIFTLIIWNNIIQSYALWQKSNYLWNNELFKNPNNTFPSQVNTHENNSYPIMKPKRSTFGVRKF